MKEVLREEEHRKQKKEGGADDEAGRDEEDEDADEGARRERGAGRRPNENGVKGMSYKVKDAEEEDEEDKQEEQDERHRISDVTGKDDGGEIEEACEAKYKDSDKRAVRGRQESQVSEKTTEATNHVRKNAAV